MNTHRVKQRKDYQPSPYLITEIKLDFQLHETHTRVKNISVFSRNPLVQEKSGTLFLPGENLKLIEIKINNTRLEQYNQTDKGLELFDLPDHFELMVETEINPDQNTSLEGLYRSSGNYCTQCEAEGFRKITYYLDRPDIMARFTTRIEGSAEGCPVMLSNGNLIERGRVGTDRHFVVWEDPFPKPCYLFALVAGKLACISDNYQTSAGKDITLEIYVEERNKNYCDHAMNSLKKAMKWDEEVYGLSYDLDTYMIVAVDDFNMGAMENKGLNIFNSKYVLASSKTATDQDYLGIEGVIAHEYFHNWTGNRVTCRDWFQLSLKEGLTVFRDQEFSADMNSRAVQRIDDVKILRDYQFREDAGPMAHPVRPDSYVEINNFYTATVYNKGAEVIRMMHTILGAENFGKGMNLYFARHDGQAVTCDDFAAAMADASGINLDQFKLWYSQAGTPVVSVKQGWDEAKNEYRLTISQSCPETPGQKEKQPFHMPLHIGLLAENGQELHNEVLHLKEAEQTFIFTDISSQPILSFNRGFSSPVRVEPFQSGEELAFLMAHDCDLFNRWEAANTLAGREIFRALELLPAGKYQIDSLFLAGIRANLEDRDGDKSLTAQAISLPSEFYLSQQMKEIEPELLHLVRKEVMAQISSELSGLLLEIYQENREQEEYKIDNESVGRRRLKNVCLGYLLAGRMVSEDILQLCQEQYQTSRNMTDQLAALKELASLENSPVRDAALADFYDKWQHDPLVMDKWLAIQAASSREKCLEDVLVLMANPCFSMDNPNKVRALIGSFGANHARFHDADGHGYRFLADQIIKLNAINPQIAARLLTPLASWKKYHEKYQGMMKNQLERILGTENLSPDVYEIAKKSL